MPFAASDDNHKQYKSFIGNYFFSSDGLRRTRPAQGGFCLRASRFKASDVADYWACNRTNRFPEGGVMAASWSREMTERRPPRLTHWRAARSLWRKFVRAARRKLRNFPCWQSNLLSASFPNKCAKNRWV